jgi:hypothetical protein
MEKNEAIIIRVKILNQIFFIVRRIQCIFLLNFWFNGAYPLLFLNITIF